MNCTTRPAATKAVPLPAMDGHDALSGATHPILDLIYSTTVVGSAAAAQQRAVVQRLKARTKWKDSGYRLRPYWRLVY